MATRIPRRIVTAALVDRLAEIPNLTVYLRRVGFVFGSTVEVPPPTVSAQDLRVRPYVVVYPPTGVDATDRMGAHRPGMIWRPQLTCVVGDETALDPLLDAIAGKLDRWRPAFEAPYDDVLVGFFNPVDGYDAGPGRRDDDVSPARFWTPLLYGIALST